eukprot:TRINITY_DN32865_c0_g1_i1.p2 TRINITY_DN32865_c0_g1~~TRINITY_DN32865_c0_g1_i1.p2  ORF type:complete len:245 (+),score=50.17 TRINITY_DN32865_c0_g1_i1:90-824(+)
MALAIQPPGSTAVPSIEEHQANLGLVRSRIAAMRERNALLAKQTKSMRQKVSYQGDERAAARDALVDIDDRMKFVRIASVKNPSPIGQYAPNLKGPPAHEFYQRQVALVRNASQTLLSKEAEAAAGKGGAKSGGAKVAGGKHADPAAEWRTERHIASNFSPFAGNTMNGVRYMEDATLLGLRSHSHTGAHKKPGPVPRVLPHDMYDYQKHTNAYLARSGSFEVGRSRAHISAITHSASAAAIPV